MKKTENVIPEHLSPASKELWLSVVDAYVMEPHDLVVLQSLCETLDRKNAAETELRDLGTLTFRNRHGESKPYPQISVIRDCNTTIARLRRELNLSEIEAEDSRPPRLVYGGKR